MTERNGPVTAAWQARAEDIELIAAGAGVLGSGGGGNAHIGKLVALSALSRGQAPPIISPAALADEALVIAVAQIGAPVILGEKLLRGTEAEWAVAALEEHLGERAVALACDEIGGINSMTPLAVAAERGLPLVDADGMGRAFPQLQMDAFTIDGISNAPTALCDDRGNVSIVVATPDALWTERLGRALTIAMGGLAYLAKPLRGAELKRAAIWGSYTRAREIGLALQWAQQAGNLRALDLERVGGHTVFHGVVADVERQTTRGATRGIAAIAGCAHYAGATLRVDLQNEYLLVRLGSEIIATTPAAISLLDDETGEPVVAESLCAGLRVIVVVLAADAKLTTPEALRIVGPAAFGYDIAYRSTVHPVRGATRPP